jgi:hypothetical protein
MALGSGNWLMLIYKLEENLSLNLHIKIPSGSGLKI